MKLTELSPRWLEDQGGRRWLLFRSPTGHKDWITCKNFDMKVTEQLEKIYEICPDLIGQPVVACKKDCLWKIEGDLSNLTVRPSIDASASGNWHGFISNGNV